MTTFSTTRRVDFGDTDMAGIMHFANFFRFMESAEIDFLMSRGLSVAWHDAKGKLGLPRVSASCDYTRPAKFMDVLAITLTVERVGAKSITYRFEFANQRGEALAVGRITAVCCRTSATGQIESIEIPAEVRAKLEA
jgi:YbgC/YbaW family acyl-CoA thioester hydrolase